MHTPRANIFIFGAYLLASLVILAVALILPGFRANRLLARAPLRDWLLDTALPAILPKPDPVMISVLYSTEKEAWLEDVIREFEASQPTLENRRPIQIQLEKMGSREIYTAVLDGTRKPDVISPASMLQIAILHDLSTGQFGKPVVNPADRTTCRSTVITPLVLVSWKERADVLWDDQPGNRLWIELHDVLVNSRGWGAFGRPEWGYVKFGHTDPLKSNSGFMTILLMTYNYFNKTSGLTSNDILSDQVFQQWFIEAENAISQFEYSTGPLMQKMIAYGPSTYDLVAVYEATAIEQFANATGRYGELNIYYPPATVWSDHPFCVLQADWVTPEKAQAAQFFIDYLLSKPAQEVALIKYGFRPVDASIPIEQPGSPFVKYAANGLRSNLADVPVVEVPEGSVLNTLLEFWSRAIDR
jgi:ABC-type molybdate transport system substrate-binding protein